MRRVRVAVAPLGVVLLLSACGLPVPADVQAPGQVSAEQDAAPEVLELPPGPAPGASASDVVFGFLRAQVSGAQDHAVARQFLAVGTRATWEDDAGATIYDPEAVQVAPDPADETRVVVRMRALARIAEDGGYGLEDHDLEEVYRLRRDEQGQLRLSDVPTGLRLPPAGASLLFDPEVAYFVRPSATPRPSDQLVPDRVFLPASDSAAVVAEALVRRLLAGPSTALAGAVVTAFPAGTELRAPVAVRDGVVTVDLTGGVRSTDPATRRQLSAQLVWTLQEGLPGAPSVRLLVEGAPLDASGADTVQDTSDWLAFDPVRAAGSAAALYVDGERRLQRIDGTPTRSPATDGTLPVDLVAVSPSTGRLALLSRGADPAGDVVLIGPPAGPFERVLVTPSVRSLSWGGGERGLWVVGGADGAPPRLQLVPVAGGPPVEVPVTLPPDAGPLSSVRISRDEARVAVVAGIGADRRVLVGQLAGVEGALRATGLRAVAPGLVDVADVAWESGTSLVALARFGTPDRLPVRVTVDGSEIEPVRTIGLVGEPQTVAGAPGRPLVVGSTLTDGRQVLLVEVGGTFEARPGRAPAYPG